MRRLEDESTSSSSRSAAPSATSSPSTFPGGHPSAAPRGTGRNNSVNVHLTLVPFIAAADGLKTKPTQHSVRELQAIGLSADVLLCRCDRPLPEDVKRKIALFCNLSPEQVISAQDVSTIYEVPLRFCREGLDEILLDLLNLPHNRRDLRLEGRWSARSKPEPPRAHRHRRQVRGAAGCLPEPQRTLIPGGVANDAEVERWSTSTPRRSRPAMAARGVRRQRPAGRSASA
ncbi:MAG: hypothetical protein R2991_12040 [Thermoanaerobaculia bacterium]